MLIDVIYVEQKCPIYLDYSFICKSHGKQEVGVR
jgi:hypothetical protein